MQNFAAMLLALALLLVPSCHEDPPPTEGASSATAAADDAKAAALWKKASISLPKNKVVVYRRLLALFPRSKYAPKAHLGLVFYLIDLGRNVEALEAANSFSQQFPDDLNVEEAYSWCAKRASVDSDPKGLKREVVFQQWSAWQEAAWKRAAPEDGDRRAKLQIARGSLAAWRGQRKVALDHLRGAAAIETEDPALTMRALYRLASLQGSAPETREEAIANLERVVKLREKHPKVNGVPLLEQLQREIAALR